MPSYAFPVAPPSPYTEKAASKPYLNRRNQLQSTFSNQDHSHGYVVVPSLNTTSQLGPGTKRGIIYSRYIQLALRIAQLNGAIGLLVCTACTTNLQDQQSFSLRITPSIDIFISVFAIYHLLRAATYRPASISSSYHFFALVIDACLIPFYIYIALLSKSEVSDTTADGQRWTSVFEVGAATNKLILATCLLAIILASMHCLALVISAYLALVFRRIASLPPDMNPLEAHLTSRPRKLREKISVEPKGVGDQPRPVTFFNTRSNGPATASRLNLDLPPLPQDEITNPDRVPGTQSVSKRSGNGRYNFSSIRSILKGSSMYSLNLYEDFIAPPLPRRSSKRRSEHSGASSTREVSPQRNMDVNRVSVVEEDVDPEVEEYHRSAMDFTASTENGNGFYQPIPQVVPNTGKVYSQPDLLKIRDTKQLRPLHMNPPTPPPIAIMPGPRREQSPSVPPRSPSRKPKLHAYGDLETRTTKNFDTPDGIEEDNTPWYSPAPAPVHARKGFGGRVLSRTGADVVPTGVPSQQYGFPYHPESQVTHDGASDASSGLGYKGASGVIVNGLRGRVVSGKVAEEGLGGTGETAYAGPGDRTNDGDTGRSWSGRWFGGRAGW